MKGRVCVLAPIVWLQLISCEAWFEPGSERALLATGGPRSPVHEARSMELASTDIRAAPPHLVAASLQIPTSGQDQAAACTGPTVATLLMGLVA